MSEIFATNVIASWPPKSQPTVTPIAYAKNHIINVDIYMSFESEVKHMNFILGSIKLSVPIICTSGLLDKTI